jgi:NAD(P)-dependent dehydrogenase (short-subunit alcohol dehydrogenase family)
VSELEAAADRLLTGRVAVVSGVGPGLGRAIALAFVDAGAAVVLVARDGKRLDKIASEVRTRDRDVSVVEADITVAPDRARIVAQAVAQWGRLDILVNNAFAMGPMAPALEIGDDEWRAVVEVNLVATVALSIEAARWMVEHGGGSIVMVNSQAARRGAPRRGPYAASKAGLLAAAQVLASELGPSGIRVNSVVPGQIWGESLESHYEQVAARRGVTVADVVAGVVRDIPLRRIPSAEEIAAAVVFLAGDGAAAITGQALDVNAGNWFH